MHYKMTTAGNNNMDGLEPVAKFQYLALLGGYLLYPLSNPLV